jgi:hypothetical protein
MNALSTGCPYSTVLDQAGGALVGSGQRCYRGIRLTVLSRDQADGALGYAAVPRADLAADAPP